MATTPHPGKQGQIFDEDQGNLRKFSALEVRVQRPTPTPTPTPRDKVILAKGRHTRIQELRYIPDDVATTEERQIQVRLNGKIVGWQQWGGQLVTATATRADATPHRSTAALRARFVDSRR